MNNKLSTPVIDRMNNADTSTLTTLFTDIVSDTDYTTRKAEREGVYNRLKLKAAEEYKFGREASGIPVYIRPFSKSESDPNVRLNLKCHKDYPNKITANKSGYLAGFTVVSTKENDPILKTIEEFNRLNDMPSVFNDMVKRSCAYGKKSLNLYTDNKTGDLRVSSLEPWNYAPFYDEHDNLVSVMSWQEITDSVKDQYSDGKFLVSFTTEKESMYFIQDAQGVLVTNSIDYPATVLESGLQIDDGRIPHLFNGVPVIEFKNNGDELGDVEKTLDMQDIRDELISKASTEMSAFASVTLVNKDDKGETIDITTMFEEMGDFGMLAGNWEWLEKLFQAYPQIQAHYQQMEHDIYESSNSYDPDALGSEGSGVTAFQIRQKMKGLQDSAVDTESQFKGALLELYRLVLTYGASNNSTDYKNLDINFIHKMPTDQMANFKQAKEAGYQPSSRAIIEELGLDYKQEVANKEEDRASIMAELDDESGFNEEGLPTPTEGAAVGQTGAGVQMNGAQVTAATGIVKEVVAGILPKSAALNMLKNFFNLTTEQANSLFAGVKAGSNKEAI